MYQSYLADPATFAAELRAVPSGTVVIVDEVQRLPFLLNEVHRHIEDRGLRFVLCGSSSRKLKTAGTNLLAGRAVWRQMHSLVPEELGDDFDLASSSPLGISAGDLVSDETDRSARGLRTALPEGGGPGGGAGRVTFPASPGSCRSRRSSMVRSSTSRASRATKGVARTTVAGYLDILEDTLSPSVCRPSSRGYGCESDAIRSCTGPTRTASSDETAARDAGRRRDRTSLRRLGGVLAACLPRLSRSVRRLVLLGAGERLVGRG